MKKEKEKEYRWRIKEGERALILGVLARSLQMDVMGFWDENAKELKAYNKSVYRWSDRAKIRESLLQANGAIIREIRETDALLQKLSREGTGRPWIRAWDPLNDGHVERILALCDRILTSTKTVPMSS